MSTSVICLHTCPDPELIWVLALTTMLRSGAFGWRLSKDEMAALDKESSKLPSALGAPFENW